MIYFLFLLQQLQHLEQHLEQQFFILLNILDLEQHLFNLEQHLEQQFFIFLNILGINSKIRKIKAIPSPTPRTENAEI